MSDSAANDAGPPASNASWTGKVLQELGIAAVYRSTYDVKLLIIQRFIRLFAYGASTLVLVSYLAALGITDTRIGLFMTLTLVGDVFISFALTLVTDGIGRRRMLCLGALLMAASGVVFGLSEDYWALLAAATFGIISPSGNEIGPFRAIEESTLAHLSPRDVRADIFAWYSLIGSAGTACGMIACGWAVNAMQVKGHRTEVESYRRVFFAYAIVGVIKLILAACLSTRCEAEQLPPPASTRDTETAPLLGDSSHTQTPKKQYKPFLPQISAESRGIFLKLALLFGLDAFASGLAPLSWTTNYFKRTFNLAEGYLGTLFFTTSIIAALSVLVAASLARRIGNIKTMVFTHAPSAIALALLGIPRDLRVAMALLVFRACTQSMDVAPRSAFLANVLLPNERTAVMGAINVVKTATQSLGPVLTGVLVSRQLFWVAFLVAGSLKVMYDLSILYVFINHRVREEGT